MLQAGAIVPDETEAFIGTDGWFALLTAIAGLIAALVVWTRRSWRGPAAVVALALGGVVGALVTALVGHLTGGGAVEPARLAPCITLPVSLHATGLLFLESAVAVLVYGLLVAFTTRDDLGRTEAAAHPQTQPTNPESASPAGTPIRARSVRHRIDPERAGVDRRGPGLLEQGDLSSHQHQSRRATDGRPVGAASRFCRSSRVSRMSPASW